MLCRCSPPGDIDARQDQRLGHASMILRATAPALSTAVKPSISTANSSPPKRATTSTSRTQPETRSATARSTWSPVSCPRLSLIFLKRSRSRNRTDRNLPLRPARWIACANDCLNRVRLGKPVSSSWSARKRVRSSDSLRVVTSCRTPSILSADPASSRLTNPRACTCATVSSCRIRRNSSFHKVSLELMTPSSRCCTRARSSAWMCPNHDSIFGWSSSLRCPNRRW